MTDPSDLIARGWPVFPVQGSTATKYDDWKVPLRGLRWREAACLNTKAFDHPGYGIGLPTGKAIGAWVLDIDTKDDGPAQLRLLEQEHGQLPKTLTSITGSGGLHLFFTMMEGLSNRTAVKPGIDVRGEGGYVVAPGSPHPGGRRYQWADPKTPIVNAPEWLLDLVMKRTAPLPSPAKAPAEVRNGPAYGKAALERACKTVLDAPSGTRNDTLNKAAFSLRDCIERGFISKDKCIDELQLAGEQAGMAAQEVRKTLVYSALKDVFEPEPAIDELDAPSPGAPSNAVYVGNASPLRLAEKYIELNFADLQGRKLLRRWAGTWWQYIDGAYASVEEERLDEGLWRMLDRIHTHSSKGPVKLDPKVATVMNVRSALIGAGTLISSDRQPPTWIGEGPSALEPMRMVPVANGLLDLETGELRPVTPDLFVTAALPVEWAPDAPEPRAWIDFLMSLWPEDPESIALLREWFGYCLTADGSQQKLLLIYGPKRSGKGTIIRVKTKMLGGDNVAGPTLAGLTNNFGLAPLLGKLVAVVGDARMPPRADQQNVVLERLLSITGQDRLDVDRKFKDATAVQLSTRMVLLSNELPRFNDSSGAMASRCLVLHTARSFYGFEDHTLWPRLQAELPGILKWSVEGWRSLNKRGFFLEPSSSKAAVADLNALASPVSAFVEDECELGAGESVGCEYLYDRWVEWCSSRGFQPSSLHVFARDLHAAFPQVATKRSAAGGRKREFTGIDVMARAA